MVVEAVGLAARDDHSDKQMLFDLDYRHQMDVTGEFSHEDALP